MTRSSPPGDPNPFLDPLSARLRKLRDLEAAVFWESEGWPEDPAEILEPEEILFYLEGLMEEGFLLDWRLLALAEAPGQPDHLRIYVREAGTAPPPAAGPGWQVIAEASHPAPAP